MAVDPWTNRKQLITLVRMLKRRRRQFFFAVGWRSRRRLCKRSCSRTDLEHHKIEMRAAYTTTIASTPTLYSDQSGGIFPSIRRPSTTTTPSCRAQYANNHHPHFHPQLSAGVLVLLLVTAVGNNKKTYNNVMQLRSELAAVVWVASGSVGANGDVWRPSRRAYRLLW